MRSIYLIILMYLIINVLCISNKDSNTQLVQPVVGAVVQSSPVLTGPAPVGIFAKKNLRVSPLETLTPIAVGGNKAETNPLITESNRQMLHDFNKNTDGFVEQPVFAHNRMAVGIANLPVTPITTPIVQQTVVAQPVSQPIIETVTSTETQPIIIEKNTIVKPIV